jgi:UDP-3-O-[3-hydroxymyristoyl] glucosamine N-acyltransferase
MDHEMSVPFTIADLSAVLGNSIVAISGNRGAEFCAPAAIGEAGPGAITFLRSAESSAGIVLRQTNASVVLCQPGAIPPDYSGSAALVAVADPRKAFIRVLARFFTPSRPSGIDSRAVISSGAHIDASAYIGPNAVIGRCEIGAGSVIHANVVLYDGVKIGRNVTIHAGTVIGADGFGYERGPDGAMEKFVHLGDVVIEDEVEIGSNTSIDRGSLGDTIIRRGAKIDNQVHIAHNTDVGRDAVIIANSMIGGSVKIGERAWIAPGVAILNGLTIGTDSVCGLGSVVVKSTGEGTTVMGNPAREIAEAKALLAAQKRLLEE